MVPPPCVSHNHREMYKLKKAIYGLKQAPRTWFEKFTTIITSICFSSSNHDLDLFVWTTIRGLILLSLYVDDVIVTCDNVNEISDLKL